MGFEPGPLWWLAVTLTTRLGYYIWNWLFFGIVCWTEESLMGYTIRDPVSEGTLPVPGERNPRGFAEKLEIRSRCFDASLVIDGGISYSFNDGTIATLDILDQDALRTVVLCEPWFPLYFVSHLLLTPSKRVKIWFEKLLHWNYLYRQEIVSKWNRFDELWTTLLYHPPFADILSHWTTVAVNVEKYVLNITTTSMPSSKVILLISYELTVVKLFH